MKTNFLYSTDFLAMNAPELAHTCMHLLCTVGEGSFVFNEKCYHIGKNDLVVMPNPSRAKNLAAAPGMQVEWFAADNKFLGGLLPSNNYSIGGSISLNQNPVIKVDDRQAEILLEDLHRLRDRLDDRHLLFYREMMGSLCLTMMYDIFEFHSENIGEGKISERAGFIVGELMRLLSEGTSRTHREVNWYANQLHVSEKYLSTTVKRMTGGSVMSYIDRHTIPILKEYLNNPSLSLTQIADIMNFTSLSYFSRYCTKHLGMSPSAYRSTIPSNTRGR